VIMMVLIYSDTEKGALELLSKGRELADAAGRKVSVVITGPDAGSRAKRFIEHGADRVILAAPSLEGFKAEEIADVLEGIVKDEKEDVILISSTKNGKELAPRLAAMLDAGCVTDATSIDIDSGRLRVERTVYSGNAVAKEEFASTPAVITVPGKAFDPLPPDPSRTGEVIEAAVQPGGHGSRIIEVKKMVSEGVNVEDAEIIVSCGRGFKSSDDLKMLEELADTLNGVTLGCSRPIAADLKWLSDDHWMGLSGHKVKPKLYVACGISGQIQHVAGMRDSGIIVAINKDPDAPIFNSADYGIVGDLYQVIPKLVEALKARK